jgi:hypothetical protein
VSEGRKKMTPEGGDHFLVEGDDGGLATINRRISTLYFYVMLM